MSVINEWLSPYQRSFESIKKSLLLGLQNKVPEMTDLSEGNILVIVISMFSAIAETLHYYIDNVGRESFFTTCRKYSSLTKHAKFVDYHMKSAVTSYGEIRIKMKDGSIRATDLVIKANSTFTDGSMNFLCIKDTTWYSGTYGVNIPVKQIEYNSNISLGTIQSGNSIIKLGSLGSSDFYAEGTMVLTGTIDGASTSWTLVDSFVASEASDTHYKIELDSDYLPYIAFGDGQFGAKPEPGTYFEASYGVTKGASGNLGVGQINSIQSLVTSPGNEDVSLLEVSNLNPTIGGSNYEDFGMLKSHVPLSVRTLWVAISKQDYEDLAKLVPGVDKAYVDYICGKRVDIYITPDGGGIANQTLVDEVKLFLTNRKILTTLINVYSTKECFINMNLTITGKKSFKALDIANQVTGALREQWNYNNSDISKPVRLSDTYALIDNLTMVDYLYINNLFLQVPCDSLVAGDPSLNYSLFIKDITVHSTVYLRYIQADNKFYMFDFSFISMGYSIPVGQPITLPTGVFGGVFTISISNPETGVYPDMGFYQLDIYPTGVDIIPPSLTIPIINNNSSIVFDNIIETV